MELSMILRKKSEGLTHASEISRGQRPASTFSIVSREHMGPARCRVRFARGRWARDAGEATEGMAPGIGARVQSPLPEAPSAHRPRVWWPTRGASTGATRSRAQGSSSSLSRAMTVRRRRCPERARRNPPSRDGAKAPDYADEGDATRPSIHVRDPPSMLVHAHIPPDAVSINVSVHGPTQRAERAVRS